MSWFTKETDELIVELSEEVRALSSRVAELQGEEDFLTERRDLNEDLLTLRKDIEQAKIQKDRQKEDHDRDKREVQHMVGLERNKQEFEHEQAMKAVDTARREAVLEVREGNLAEERDQFEKQMEFITERFGTEVGYLKEIFETAMNRVPSLEIVKDMSDGG